MDITKDDNYIIPSEQLLAKEETTTANGLDKQHI